MADAGYEEKKNLLLEKIGKSVTTHKMDYFDGLVELEQLALAEGRRRERERIEGAFLLLTDNASLECRKEVLQIIRNEEA